MTPHDADTDLQALTYLVTVMIHRMHETDSAWWMEFAHELNDERAAVPPGSAREKVLRRAVGLIEHSIKGSAGE